MPVPGDAFISTSTRPKKMAKSDSIVGACFPSAMLKSAPSRPYVMVEYGAADHDALFPAAKSEMKCFDGSPRSSGHDFLVGSQSVKVCARATGRASASTDEAE